MIATQAGTNPPNRVDSPTFHLSAGRYLTPSRYLVGWPVGIVKVGSTWRGRKRWGQFLSHGAELLDVAHYAKIGEELPAEVWLERQLLDLYPRAFESKVEAEPYFGAGTGGWTECFRVPPYDWPAVIRLAGGDA